MAADRLRADELAVWHALKQVSDRALGAVARAIEAGTGLSGADYGILTRLEDLGDGTLKQYALAASLDWNKARLSHQLTRMEARGLLRRARSKVERAVSVELLDAGRAAVALARPVHARAVRDHILRHLEPEERALIIRLNKRLG